jgi:hypothetical protein
MNNYDKPITELDANTLEDLLGYIQGDVVEIRKWYKRGDVEITLKMVKAIITEAEELVALLESKRESN